MILTHLVRKKMFIQRKWLMQKTQVYRMCLQIFEHNSDNLNIRRNKTLKRSSENLDITLQNLRTKKVKFRDGRTARTKYCRSFIKNHKRCQGKQYIGKLFGFFPLKDMQTPIMQNDGGHFLIVYDAQCSESNENMNKKIFRFLFFELWPFQCHFLTLKSLFDMGHF